MRIVIAGSLRLAPELWSVVVPKAFGFAAAALPCDPSVASLPLRSSVAVDQQAQLASDQADLL